MEQISLDDAMLALAVIHPRSREPQRNTCHWREKDEPDALICSHCSDFEYTFEHWPCDDLREFADAIGWSGDWEALAAQADAVLAARPRPVYQQLIPPGVASAT